MIRQHNLLSIIEIRMPHNSAEDGTLHEMGREVFTELKHYFHRYEVLVIVCKVHTTTRIRVC